MIHDLSAIKPREIFTGFHARFVHSAHTTHSWLDADAGAVAPEHRHPHEQIVNVLDGTLELTVNGMSYLLTTGMTFVIPSDVPHAARAMTRCRVLDVFSPPREDYR